MMLWSPHVVARNSLRRLNQTIFSCFLDPSYPDNLYLFERRIHQQKRKFMRAIIKCRNIQQATNLNQFFDAMMNYSQLRWRVTDFNVFSICAKELNALSQAIDSLIVTDQKNTVEVVEALQQLEDIYQQVLQISSPDPLAFLLFIAGVKALLSLPDRATSSLVMTGG